MIVAFLLIFLKAPFPTVFTLVALIVIFFNALSFLNAFLPIVVTFLPMVTVVSFVQLSNALAPMDVTVEGIVTVLIFLFFLNAFAPIALTSQEVPLMVTLDGMLALVDFTADFVRITCGFVPTFVTR